MSVSIFDLIGSTWKSFYNNPARSGLTLLGVFMGVAAVNTTLNIGSITNAKIEAKLSERDLPYVASYLRNKENFQFKSLNENDEKMLQRSITEVRSISSVNRIRANSVRFQDKNITDISVWGVSPNYIETTGRKILQGRFFNAADFAKYRSVAVVDNKLATILFEKHDSKDRSIYVLGTRLTVVGIIETKTIGAEFENLGSLWIPQTLASVLSKRSSISTLQLSSHKIEDIPNIKKQADKVLKQRYPKTIVFLEDNTKDLLKEKEIQASAIKALNIVAIVAMLIAGVGIANICVTSVMERRKEIGLRRAIGATRKDVMTQFIFEIATLSLVSGITAIIVVHIITATVTTKIIRTPYEFSYKVALLSLGSSVLVGIGASFLPAYQASRVDVIKALRSST